jgi:hypothetical protein
MGEIGNRLSTDRFSARAIEMYLCAIKQGGFIWSRQFLKAKAVKKDFMRVRRGKRDQIFKRESSCAVIPLGIGARFTTKAANMDNRGRENGFV